MRWRGKSSSRRRRALVAMQFHDQLVQRVAHVRDALTELNEALSGAPAAEVDWATVLAGIRFRYSMEDERMLFDRIIGAAACPDVNRARHHARQPARQRGAVLSARMTSTDTSLQRASGASRRTTAAAADAAAVRACEPLLGQRTQVFRGAPAARRVLRDHHARNRRHGARFLRVRLHSRHAHRRRRHESLHAAARRLAGHERLGRGGRAPPRATATSPWSG